MIYYTNISLSLYINGCVYIYIYIYILLLLLLIIRRSHLALRRQAGALALVQKEKAGHVLCIYIYICIHVT